jgi:hypothetical protein
VDESIMRELQVIDVAKMEKKVTEGDRVAYVSKNVTGERHPIYNVCFESIRVGFCIDSFVETIKALQEAKED